MNFFDKRKKPTSLELKAQQILSENVGELGLPSWSKKDRLDVKDVLDAGEKLGGKRHGQDTIDFGGGSVIKVTSSGGKIQFDGGLSSGKEEFDSVEDAIDALEQGAPRESTQLTEGEVPTSQSQLSSFVKSLHDGNGADIRIKGKTIYAGIIPLKRSDAFDEQGRLTDAGHKYIQEFSGKAQQNIVKHLKKAVENNVKAGKEGVDWGFVEASSEDDGKKAKVPTLWIETDRFFLDTQTSKAFTNVLQRWLNLSGGNQLEEGVLIHSSQIAKYILDAKPGQTISIEGGERYIKYDLKDGKDDGWEASDGTDIETGDLINKLEAEDEMLKLESTQLKEDTAVPQKFADAFTEFLFDVEHHLTSGRLQEAEPEAVLYLVDQVFRLVAIENNFRRERFSLFHALKAAGFTMKAKPSDPDQLKQYMQEFATNFYSLTGYSKQGMIDCFMAVLSEFVESKLPEIKASLEEEMGLTESTELEEGSRSTVIAAGKEALKNLGIPKNQWPKLGTKTDKDKWQFLTANGKIVGSEDNWQVMIDRFTDVFKKEPQAYGLTLPESTELEEAEYGSALYPDTLARDLAKDDGHDFDKLPEFDRGINSATRETNPSKTKYRELAKAEIAKQKDKIKKDKTGIIYKEAKSNLKGSTELEEAALQPEDKVLVKNTKPNGTRKYDALGGKFIHGNIKAISPDGSKIDIKRMGDLEGNPPQKTYQGSVGSLNNVDAEDVILDTSGKDALKLRKLLSVLGEEELIEGRNEVNIVLNAFKDVNNWGTELKDRAYKDGDRLVVFDSYYFGHERTLSDLKKAWSDGGSYAEWFKDEHGLNFEIVDSFYETLATGRHKRVVGSNMGVVGIKLEVTKDSNNMDESDTYRKMMGLHGDRTQPESPDDPPSGPDTTWYTEQALKQITQLVQKQLSKKLSPGANAHLTQWLKAINDPKVKYLDLPGDDDDALDEFWEAMSKVNTDNLDDYAEKLFDMMMEEDEPLKAMDAWEKWLADEYEYEYSDY